MSHPPISDYGLRINVNCEFNNPFKKKFGLSAAELVKSNKLGNAVLVFLNKLETSCFSSGKIKKIGYQKRSTIAIHLDTMEKNTSREFLSLVTLQ